VDLCRWPPHPKTALQQGPEESETIHHRQRDTIGRQRQKDKDKDKKNKYIHSKDIDTGVAAPKKKIFGDNTATEAKKLLSKVKKSPDKYKHHLGVRNPRYLTKYQWKEMDIALWDALLNYIDEERYDHMWTHLERGNVLELWEILDGKAASEPEEYCTALKDRIRGSSHQLSSPQPHHPTPMQFNLVLQASARLARD
jgi:hypothetical protein